VESECVEIVAKWYDSREKEGGVMLERCIKDIRKRSYLLIKLSAEDLNELMWWWCVGCCNVVEKENKFLMKEEEEGVK